MHPRFTIRERCRTIITMASNFSIHYYLSLSPVEALIASQLDPETFGTYMAIGAKNGSHERIVFAELDAPFDAPFDWDHARRRCVPHRSGEPKHSVWMAVYRVLERTPIDRIGRLYLTTRDGRTLSLRSSPDRPDTARPYYVYQELCPLTPLVVSRMDPAAFANHLTDPAHHVSVPRVVFSDLKVIDFDHPDDTGNIGRTYDRNLDHLRAIVQSVIDDPDKPSKNVERSTEGFSYQIIRDGLYIGDRSDLSYYPMPTVDTIRRDHYDWGRSAMVL